jgi:hypothetical protein
VGNLLYVSGHVAINSDGSLIKGKLGKDISDEDGKQRRGRRDLPFFVPSKNILEILKNKKSGETFGNGELHTRI